mmetsp:Transcript_27450/g.80730  ORF Transcript_27450/g.80730 Transcript_27450/m.80730 type:complete len:216 (-) Transcript_27450:18-665(-)
MRTMPGRPKRSHCAHRDSRAHRWDLALIPWFRDCPRETQMGVRRCAAREISGSHHGALLRCPRAHPPQCCRVGYAFTIGRLLLGGKRLWQGEVELFVIGRLIQMPSVAAELLIVKIVVQRILTLDNRLPSLVGDLQHRIPVLPTIHSFTWQAVAAVVCIATPVRQETRERARSHLCLVFPFTVLYSRELGPGMRTSHSREASLPVLQVAELHPCC